MMFTASQIRSNFELTFTTVHLTVLMCRSGIISREEFQCITLFIYKFIFRYAIVKLAILKD